MKTDFPKTCKSRAGIGIAALSAALMLNVAVLSATAAAPAVTNATSRWPTRQEVQKKWGQTPLEDVQRAATNKDLTAQHYLGLCYATGDRVQRDPATAVGWYQRAADAGYMPSMNNLGFLYQTGDGVARDLVQARRCYEIAAAAGHAQAQANLGFLYRDGIGIARNPQEAMKWFQRAADQGHTVAMVNVGRSYRLGNGVPKDLQAALRWFNLAAQHGDPLGILNLGWVYEYENATRDENEAFRLFMKAAEQGQRDAMYELSLSYLNGRGVIQDETAGRSWLTKAAEAGHAGAQCELGYYYENQIGAIPYYRGAISNNMPEALKWYRRSAEQNWAGGQCRLGLCYLEGKGVELDEEQALEWIRKASDQQQAFSMVKLAELYSKGIGEPRGESDRPIKLLRGAAEKNFKEADDALVFRCQNGLGTERDLVEAAEWYCHGALNDRREFRRSLKDRNLDRLADKARQVDPFTRTLALYLKAADPANADAPAQLGEMYVAGKDAPQSAAKAWVWFDLATRRGSSDAVARRDLMEKGMTRDELAEARQRTTTIATLLAAVLPMLAPLHDGSGNQE